MNGFSPASTCPSSDLRTRFLIEPTSTRAFSTYRGKLSSAAEFHLCVAQSCISYTFAKRVELADVRKETTFIERCPASRNSNVQTDQANPWAAGFAFCAISRPIRNTGACPTESSYTLLLPVRVSEEVGYKGIIMTSNPSGRTSIPSSVDADVDSSQQPEPHSSRQATPQLPDIVRIGLTEVWSPSDKTKIDADVCFVHGLGGHPFTTWQYKKHVEKKTSISRAMQRLKCGIRGHQKGETKEGALANGRSTCFWPFDLLQRDFDSIRILTYGYDSSPTHCYVDRSNQMTIDQHTQTLLQKISDQRMSCTGRPIIFVAHSLGGILVKNLVIESRKYANLDGNSYMSDIYSSCHAIVFFGTPHRGASSAELGSMVANVVSVLPGSPSVYKDLLRNLRPDSEKLVSIIRDFNDILLRNAPASEKIQIYSFQEGKGYAAINIFDHKVMETHVIVEASHSQLTRWYQMVLRY